MNSFLKQFFFFLHNIDQPTKKLQKNNLFYKNQTYFTDNFYLRR